MQNDQIEIQSFEMARFGHTITQINDTQMLLFGGAVEASRG